MSLIKKPEETNVSERYKNIIEQKEDWKNDINPFLYDCFTELRKKISLINMGMYKSRIFLIIPFLLFAVGTLIGGIMTSSFMKTVSISMFILSVLFFIISLSIIFLILFKGLKTKKRLKYLNKIIKNINSKSSIRYNNDLEQLIKLFIKNGRSGFIAGSAVRPGNYYNSSNINNMNNMAYFTPTTYNPVLGQQINDMILLSDLFEEINWEKLINLYNSLY